MATSKKTATKKPVAKKPSPKSVEKEPKIIEPVEEYVDFIIPLDPSLDSRHQLFECCLNGDVRCYSRGEMLHLKKESFEFISSLLREIEHVSPEVAEFENGSKRLDF